MKLKKWTASGGEENWVFYCPGCKYQHPFRVKAATSRPGDSVWSFDGNMHAPTFAPSLVVNRGTATQCHLFLKAGMLIYISDSHHALAGKTVPLEDFE